ncbi:MAG TPA: hypothetical protein VIJ19_06395 [Opitutaceae bacterium]
MTNIEDAMDQELDLTHARLVLDLLSVGGGQGVYILNPPPADDPE